MCCCCCCFVQNNFYLIFLKVFFFNFKIRFFRGKCRVKLVKDIRCVGTPSGANLTPNNNNNNSSGERSAADVGCSDGAVATIAPTSESTSALSASASTSVGIIVAGNDTEDNDEDLLKSEDTFFTCLNFNQDSSRLASVQGSIRVGSHYQVKQILFFCSANS